ncbi:MAG: cytochrome c [Planctomycetales bacterium]|nr:cytochrome c [Planctomycetales bacterium]
MKRLATTSLLLIIACAYLTSGVAQDASSATVEKSAPNSDSASQAKDDGPSHWMSKKMKLSTEVFEGIASEDFEKISKSAREMKVLSKAEHFVRSNPSGYRTQLQLFRFANNELIRAANSESIESVTLAFNQLTVSCVNCHRLIRVK